MEFNFYGFEACVHLLCLFFQRDEPGPDSYPSVRTLTTLVQYKSVLPL